MTLGSVGAAGVARGTGRVAVQQNRELKRTTRQTKRANRELLRYTAGVGFSRTREAFPTGDLAKCYAVVRLLLGNLPTVRAEAGGLIACMARDQDAGLLDYVRRPTRKARSIRRRAMQPLVDRYAYPSEGWLDRLNSDIRRRQNTLDAYEEEHMIRDKEHYRMVIVDPAFRPLDGGAAR